MNTPQAKHRVNYLPNWVQNETKQSFSNVQLQNNVQKQSKHKHKKKKVILYSATI